MQFPKEQKKIHGETEDIHLRRTDSKYMVILAKFSLCREVHEQRALAFNRGADESKAGIRFQMIATH